MCSDARTPSTTPSEPSNWSLFFDLLHHKNGQNPLRKRTLPVTGSINSFSFVKAIEILKSNFASKAVKKSDRETTEGVIGSYIHNGKKGIMVSLSCETDFVARNQDFKDLANNIALQVASLGIDNIYINEILESSYIKDPSITIEELIKSKIVTIGENIKIKGIVTISL